MHAMVVGQIGQSAAPLTGYRIAVTSARRSEELCALLSRQGAEVCSAAAINMIRLDAYWTGHPLDRTRTSHLARLDFTLTA